MIEYKIKSSSELESAILINVAGKRDDIEQIEEYLDELEFLALTYGAETKKGSFNDLKDLINQPILVKEKF